MDIARITYAEVSLARTPAEAEEASTLAKALPLLLVVGCLVMVWAPAAIRPYMPAVVGFAFAAVMAFSGKHTTIERKGNLLTFLRVQYQGLRSGPGTVSAIFETLVDRLSAVHRRIWMTQAVVVPALAAVIGGINLADVLLRMDTDHTTMPILAVVYLCFILAVAILAMEHRRLRRLLASATEHDASINA